MSEIIYNTNETNTPENPPEKKKRGKPITALWRHNEDGTYKNTPLLGNEYFRKYYHEHLAIKINCELCNRQVNLQKIKRHQASRICSKYSNKSDANIC